MSSSGYSIEVDAVVLRSPGTPLAVERIRLRDVGPDDVRVRIDVTGVCHSDLSLARGVMRHALPAVLGHEASGTIVEVGAAVTDVAVGDRVILLWNAPCGSCIHCVRGESHLCPTGLGDPGEPHAVDVGGHALSAGLGVGSFAEQTVLPAATVVPLPEDIDSCDAALLGCAVTTGVGAVTRTVGVRRGSSVVVIGLGGVGLSAVQGARLSGAGTVIAIDRNADKERFAEHLGADKFILADDDTKAEVRRLTGGHGADYAFDCVGSARTIRDAWSMTRRGGTACIVGIGSKHDRVSFNALELYHFARTLTVSVAGSMDTRDDFPSYFDRARSGALNLRAMVTGHGHLTDIQIAFDQMRRGEGVRTAIVPQPSCSVGTPALHELTTQTSVE